MTTPAGSSSQSPDTAGDAEAVLRQLFDAAVKGNNGPLYEALTSAAYVDMLHLSKAAGGSKTLTSYTLGSHTITGDDHRFAVALVIGKKKFASTTTLRIERETWRVAAVKVPGVRD